MRSDRFASRLRTKSSTENGAAFRDYIFGRRVPASRHSGTRLPILHQFRRKKGFPPDSRAICSATEGTTVSCRLSRR